MKKEETARQTSIQEKKKQKHLEIRFMMHLRMRERS